MKKAFVSALCSALVIPGLGQIMNQHVKKGVSILLAIFLLFVAGVIKLFHLTQAVLKDIENNRSDPGGLMDTLRAQDISLLWYLLGALTILWFYSVLDAYLTGKKIDQRGGKDRL